MAVHGPACDMLSNMKVLFVHVCVCVCVCVCGNTTTQLHVPHKNETRYAFKHPIVLKVGRRNL